MAEKRGADFSSSWVASGDLSGAQYRAVTYSGMDVFLPTTAVICAGILQNKPRDNEHAGVVAIGYTKVILGSSLGSPLEIMAGANGFITAAGSGAYVLGQLISAGDSGTIQEALLSPYRKGLV